MPQIMNVDAGNSEALGRVGAYGLDAFTRVQARNGQRERDVAMPLREGVIMST